MVKAEEELFYPNTLCYRSLGTIYQLAMILYSKLLEFE